MNGSRSLTALAAALLGGAVLLTVVACASGSTSAGGSGLSDPPPAAPAANPAAAGEVLAQGTVLQHDGEPAMLCLGPVAESYPPQCTGPEIAGWDWSAVDGAESASGVTWGAYAVQGTWDGSVFTPTQAPIMLALYDPMYVPDPFTDPANAGDTTEAELLDLQQRVHEDASLELLGSWPENGYLFLQVIHDDGSLQRYVDERYGEGIVQVRSALRPVEE